MTRYNFYAEIILLSVLLSWISSPAASENPSQLPETIATEPEGDYECQCNVRKRQQVEARLAKKAAAAQNAVNTEADQLSQSTDTSAVSGSD